MGTDLSAWLKEAEDEKPAYRQCQTCLLYPMDLLEDIQEFKDGKAKGEIRVSIKTFHRGYMVPKGYGLTYSALQKHIRDCCK